MSLRQRFADYLRERRIRKLADEIELMQRVREFAIEQERVCVDAMAMEMQCRSQAQIARLETSRKVMP